MNQSCTTLFEAAVNRFCGVILEYQSYVAQTSITNELQFFQLKNFLQFVS